MRVRTYLRINIEIGSFQSRLRRVCVEVCEINCWVENVSSAKFFHHHEQQDEDTNCVMPNLHHTRRSMI